MARISTEGSLEATRRHIQHGWPAGATLANTLDAAILAHVYDKTHPGYGPLAAATLLMDRYGGDYAALCETYDNFRQTGVLWLGAVVTTP